MYSLLYFQDDCVIHTETNTVIFNTDKEWEDFIVWSTNNSDELEKLKAKKKAYLLWNQGEPTLEGYAKLYHNEEGKLFKKVYPNKTEFYDKLLTKTVKGDTVTTNFKNSETIRYISSPTLLIENYPDGSIRGKGGMLRGRPYGEWKYYHWNGELESKYYFKNGKLDGTAEQYNEDGTLIATQTHG